jgi:hypothetical protein
MGTVPSGPPRVVPLAAAVGVATGEGSGVAAVAVVAIVTAGLGAGVLVVGTGEEEAIGAVGSADTLVMATAGGFGVNGSGGALGMAVITAVRIRDIISPAGRGGGAADFRGGGGEEADVLRSAGGGVDGRAGMGGGACEAWRFVVGTGGTGLAAASLRGGGRPGGPAAGRFGTVSSSQPSSSELSGSASTSSGSMSCSVAMGARMAGPTSVLISALIGGTAGSFDRGPPPLPAPPLPPRVVTLAILGGSRAIGQLRASGLC